MVVSKEKWDALIDKMHQLKINEDDLVEKFILGSGKGGQKIQKTYSCVYLKYIPMDLVVKCQKTRFRDDNRYFARKELCEKIIQIKDKQKSERVKKIEKIRRQKRKRSKRSQEKILKDKKIKSKKKLLRKEPKDNI